MQSRRVLIVEDDGDLLEVLKLNLEAKGFSVQTAGDGERGLHLAAQNDFEMIILDLDLPGMDGLEVCRKIRAKDEIVPILMLTCHGQELDKVVGLEVGADDYLTKPFAMNELLARVKALQRRLKIVNRVGGLDGIRKKIEYLDLSIDPEMRQVKLAGKDLELTPLEFGFLVFLASHPGRPFSRSEILAAVWGSQHTGYEQAVTSTAKRLRAKLEGDLLSPKYLHSVRGIGYRFGPALT